MFPSNYVRLQAVFTLFKLTGSINSEDVTLHRNTIWDILDIDWQNITVTLNGSVINLPGSVIIPFRDKI